MKPRYRWTGEAWRMTDSSVRHFWSKFPEYLRRGDLDWNAARAKGGLRG